MYWRGRIGSLNVRGQRSEIRGQKSELGKAGRTAMIKKIILPALCSLLHALSSRRNKLAKVARIGFLTSTTASGSAVLLEAFRQELGKLGWMDGKNITFEYRFAE